MVVEPPGPSDTNPAVGNGGEVVNQAVVVKKNEIKDFFDCRYIINYYNFHFLILC